MSADSSSPKPRSVTPGSGDGDCPCCCGMARRKDPGGCSLFRPYLLRRFNDIACRHLPNCIGMPKRRGDPCADEARFPCLGDVILDARTEVAHPNSAGGHYSPRPRSKIGREPLPAFRPLGVAIRSQAIRHAVALPASNDTHIFDPRTIREPWCRL